jgi:hypothetical protein
LVFVTYVAGQNFLRINIQIQDFDEQDSAFVKNSRFFYQILQYRYVLHLFLLQYRYILIGLPKSTFKHQS